MKQTSDAWLLYGEKVMELFKNPPNVGRMENLDGVGHVGNPVCGDIMELYTRIDDGMIAGEHLESRHRLNV